MPILNSVAAHSGCLSLLFGLVSMSADRLILHIEIHKEYQAGNVHLGPAPTGPPSLHPMSSRRFTLASSPFPSGCPCSDSSNMRSNIGEMFSTGPWRF